MTPELSTRLATSLEKAVDHDWYLALFYAALEQSHDPAKAIEAADSAILVNPTAPVTAATDDE